MNNWQVIFATVVIFGAGVGTGGLLVNHADHAHSRNFHRPAAATNAVVQAGSVSQPKLPRLPEIMSKDFTEKLDGFLQFTPEQRAAIEKIMADSQGQVRKAVQDLRQDARQKIRELLTPDQQKQFDELMKHPPHRPQNGTNSPVREFAPTNFPVAH